jgi:cation diffusion facilitator family transporter
LSSNKTLALRGVWWDLGGGLLAFFLLLVAYGLTGSVALFSAAWEAALNLLTSGGTLLALRVAGQPPDRNHPFGHTKAEDLWAAFEAALVLLSALGIARAALGRWLHPVPLHRLDLGLGILAAVGLMRWELARFLLEQSRRARSPALRAEGRHLLSDALTSLVLLLGLGLAWLSHRTWIDPLLSLLVALLILRLGWRIVRESVASLMDEGLTKGELAQLQRVLEETLRPWKDRGIVSEYHGLRTRRAGGSTFLDLHLVVRGDLSVAAAHQICDELETALQRRLPEVQATIHVEPGPSS